MMRLLDEAKWMNGAVWTAIMFIAFAVYELHYLGGEPTWAYFTRSLVIWGAAGAGYAILTGYFARRRAEEKAQKASAGEPQTGEAPLPTGDRAARRRAQKERLREQKR